MGPWVSLMSLSDGPLLPSYLGGYSPGLSGHSSVFLAFLPGGGYSHTVFALLRRGSSYSYSFSL